MSLRMGKPTICIGENKGADQLCSNCTADQRLCFRYSDSTIPPLLIPKISSFYPAFVTVQPGLCLTWSETQMVVFSTHRLIFVFVFPKPADVSHGPGAVWGSFRVTFTVTSVFVDGVSRPGWGTIGCFLHPLSLFLRS